VHPNLTSEIVDERKTGIIRRNACQLLSVLERDREIAGIAAEAYECLKSVAIAGMAHQVLFQDRHCPAVPTEAI